jgi:hypothetical protein
MVRELDDYLGAATEMLDDGAAEEAYEQLRQAFAVDPLDPAIQHALAKVGEVLRDKARQSRRRRSDAGGGRSPTSGLESEPPAAAEPEPAATPAATVVTAPAPSDSAIPSAPDAAGETLLALTPFSQPLRWEAGAVPILVTDQSRLESEGVNPAVRVPVLLRCSRPEEALAVCVLDELARGNRVLLTVGEAELVTSVRFDQAGSVRFDVALKLLGRALDDRLSRGEIVEVKQEVARHVNQAYRAIRKWAAPAATLLGSFGLDEVELVVVPFVSRCLPCSWASGCPADAPRWQTEPYSRATGEPLVEQLDRLESKWTLVAVELRGTMHVFALDLDRVVEQNAAEPSAGRS